MRVTTRQRERTTLVLTLAAGAGIHAALVPTHAGEGTPVAVMFALSAAVLAVTALLVDHSERPAVHLLAALVLATLLALYAVSRFAVVWPLAHAEAVEALGALTKLLEAAGLVLALRLLKVPAGSTVLSARQQGAGP